MAHHAYNPETGARRLIPPGICRECGSTSGPWACDSEAYCAACARLDAAEWAKDERKPRSAAPKSTDEQRAKWRARYAANSDGHKKIVGEYRKRSPQKVASWKSRRRPRHDD